MGDWQVEAEFLGSDPRSDIAVLRIPARGLKQLPLGDSDKTQVGDYVVAIGNPFAVRQTVTAGIVSGLRRPPAGGAPFHPSRATNHPGKPAGPLINNRCERVGLNSAINVHTCDRQSCV